MQAARWKGVGGKSGIALELRLRKCDWPYCGPGKGKHGRLCRRQVREEWDGR